MTKRKTVYTGRNRAFAIAMIRYIPKSRNKKKYYRPKEKNNANNQD